MANPVELLQHYQAVRRQSIAMAEGLSAEDLLAQSMPDASPGKWHLAHTTWFFETFILQQYHANFQWFNDSFCYLFNSYYDSVGDRHERPQRGLLTRPSLQEVIDYRHDVDARMETLISRKSADIEFLLTIGLHHEMQHQELFLTDLLHLLSHNPLHPQVIARDTAKQSARLLTMRCVDGGVVAVGAEQVSQPSWEGFSYDCEQPSHEVLLQPFKLANRLVNNREWIAFIEDGGYENPLLWLSDGWAYVQQAQWRAPLYWQQRDESWFQFSLAGRQAIDLEAPVCHVSYYEADAYARWSGKRLPREHEWELAAAHEPIVGNFLENHTWQPCSGNDKNTMFDSLYGDVWEWTQSAFSPYPGFKSKQGALGEYNGKFMVNQFVLKGGSCATPRLQMRASYRNFFHPHQRWQFAGVRLAEDND